MNLTKKDILKLNKVVSNLGDMNFKRRIENIVTKIDAQEKDKILDCGCGDGLFLVALSEIGKGNLTGMDLDVKNLSLAAGYLKGKKVKLVHGDITKLPFKDASFNKIYSSEVLEHVPNDKKAAKELFRVLKKGGKLVVTVPNKNYPFVWDPLNKLLEIFFKTHIQSGFWAGIWNQHLRLYSLEEITNLIEKAGFRILDRKALTHYCFPFHHIFLYGLKQVLRSGILPEKIARTSDKFRWKETEQSKLIRFGYWFLNFIDRPNNNLPLRKSSVNILIEAEKI